MIKLKQFLAMLLVLFSTFSIAQFSSTPTQMGSTYYGVSPQQYVGWSVDLSADGFTMAVGQRNSLTTNTNQFVKIFKWNSATSLWDLKGSPIPAPNKTTVFGCTVTLTDDGNTVAIGDFSLNQTKGAVYIYDWNGSAWVLRSGTIYGNTINEAVGIEGGVDISGDGKFLAVGSFTNVAFGGYTNPGTVKIYSWDNATSTWQQKGNTLNKSNATNDDHFGKVSISKDGNIVAVGYPQPGTKGGVELYSYNAATNTWSQKGSTISYSSGTTQVGYSVELTPDGNTVAISAATIGNAAFIYTWNGSDWQLKGSPIAAISKTQLGDQIDISSNGNSFIIGGRRSYIPGTAGDNNGAALVYDWNGTVWSLRGSDFSGAKGDLLGLSVAISDDGGIVAMGAPQYSVGASPNNFQGYAKAYRYAGTDSDGDGIADHSDLDDDNDGILDTAEMCKSAISTDFHNGQSATVNTVSSIKVVPTTATLTPAAVLNYSLGWHYGDATDAVGKEMSINFSNPVYLATDEIDFTLGGLDYGSSFGNFFVVYEDGVRLSNLDFSLTIITGIINTSIINGAKAFNTAQSDSKGSLTLKGVDRTKRIIKMGYTVHALNGGHYSENITPRIQIDCDMDGDGIPNQLDLDSDGDGCPDAREGAGNFNPTATASGTLSSQKPNINFGTTVDDNGVPKEVGDSGQAVGQSQDISKNDCIDSDGDGYPDWQDLDDDNDGILDTVECSVTDLVTNGTFTGNANGWTLEGNWKYNTN